MISLDENIIERYRAGECSEADMAQILEWLKASDENREEWLKLRMVSAKSAFARFSASEHVTCSYKELLKKRNIQKEFEQEITRKITLRLMRYAATILLLVGLSVIFYKYATDWQYPKMVVVATGENEPVRLLMLEDSTQVWLSAGSRIEYPERFWKNERSVSVEGKVYIEVAKDANRPFYVKTETYTVKVLGTSFEVNAYKYSQTSDVTLVEGNVEIFDHNQISLCTIQPGQQFEINKISNRFTLQRVEAEMYASWHEGTLEFDGLTFAEIAKALERHYNVRIILGEGITRDIRLVGSLSFGKDIYQMMRAMELVVPIKYHVQTDTVVYIQSKK